MTVEDPPQTRVSGAPSARRRTPWWRSPVTVTGLILVIVGLSALGWVAYQYYGTNFVSQRTFEQTREELRQQWQQGTDPATDPTNEPSDGSEGDQTGPDPVVDEAEAGEVVALLRVPEWGEDYEVPILKGTSQSVLADGVGMYDSSVPPGEIGNFAIAGHRVTHGEPFARLLELKPGSKIVIETRTTIFTYVLDNSPADLTVKEDDNWVLQPVPGQPQATPSRALITLTTCQDLFRSPDRSVGFGHLESTVNK